jgi:hypothetical protein
MSWISITSFISYAQIAECFNIDTNTEYVADGSITPEGVNYIFEVIGNENLSDEQRLVRENQLLQKLLDDYQTPESLIRKIRWISKFKAINAYTSGGSRLDFLKNAQSGEGLQWFETENGFSLTLFPAVMIFIEDMQYLEDGTLPEFPFEEVSAEDVFIAIDQAMQNNVLEPEAQLEAFAY